MLDESQIRSAMEVGRSTAAEVIEVRDAALETRAAALESALPETAAAAEAFAAAPELVAAAGGASVGTIVAEGDSWFDYPWTDVLGMLEDEHGYEIESVAHKGDRVEDMAYSGGQLAKFTRRIEKVLRRGEIPRAILLSGGGNDIAGEELATLLNHASSAMPGLNEQIVQGVIDQRIQLAYLTILSAVTDICQDRLGRPVPILIHGYDFAVPDGRGFLGGWWLLPGPWLEPGLRRKGYEDFERRKDLIKELIERFNTMIATLPSQSGLEHVRYVDLRNMLPSGADYKDWWANELHPTKRGFREVARRFANHIP